MSDLQQLARQLAPYLNPYFPSYAGSRQLGRGTAFPSVDITLAAGDRFFRTDVMFECVYDGTRWLTAHEYVAVLAPYTPTVPAAAFYTGGVTANLAYYAPTTFYDLYVGRWNISYISDTNQSGANKWTLVLATNAATITTQDTSNATVAGNLGSREANDNTARTVTFIRLQATVKTGAPGGLWATASVNYRLVIT